MDCGAPVAVQPAAHILEDANHVLPPQSGDTRNSAEAQSEVAQKRRSERVPKRHRGMEDNSAVTDGRNGSHSPKFGKEKRRRMIRQCMGTDGDRIVSGHESFLAKGCRSLSLARAFGAQIYEAAFMPFQNSLRRSLIERAIAVSINSVKIIGVCPNMIWKTYLNFSTLFPFGSTQEVIQG